jgi:hypothetical protein
VEIASPGLSFGDRFQSPADGTVHVAQFLQSTEIFFTQVLPRSLREAREFLLSYLSLLGRFD